MSQALMVIVRVPKGEGSSGRTYAVHTNALGVLPAVLKPGDEIQVVVHDDGTSPGTFSLEVRPA